MKQFLSKLTSRKFLAAMIGVMTGCVMFIDGDKSNGMSLILASIITYISAEGIIDLGSAIATARSVMQIVDGADDLLETSDDTEEETDEQEVEE